MLGHFNFQSRERDGFSLLCLLCLVSC
uniref:Uncharacterized protein n=1 Tax=Anguilla anguilla TaxID=7936 RepID=A0A0E9TCU8_ANGAN